MAAVVSLEDARAARGRRRDPEERLRTVAEVAEHFAVHPKTVERWIRERGCPAERLYGDRGRWRLRLSEVDRWRLGIGGSTG